MKHIATKPVGGMKPAAVGVWFVRNDLLLHGLVSCLRLHRTRGSALTPFTDFGIN